MLDVRKVREEKGREGDTNRIREGKTGWPGFADFGFVDVGCCESGGLVFSRHADKGDVLQRGGLVSVVYIVGIGNGIHSR